MKLTIKTKELTQIISNAVKFVDKNYLRDTFYHQINITALGLGISVTTNPPAAYFSQIHKVAITNDGNVSVNGFELLKALKAIKSDEVTLDVDASFLTLSADSLTLSVAVSERIEGWEVPEIGNVVPYLDKDMFCNALDAVTYAMSKDETRYQLCGVSLSNNGKDDNLTFAATDGHRLALVDTKLPVSLPSKGVILPGLDVKALVSLLGQTRQEYISIGYSDKYFLVQTEACKVIIPFINAEYPDFRAILPKDLGKTPTVSTETKPFKDAVKTLVALSSEKKTKAITIQFGSTSTLSSLSDGEKRSETSIHCTTLAMSKIQLNGTYLKDLLDQVESYVVTLENVEVANSPVVVRQTTSAGQVTHVVMPMRF